MSPLPFQNLYATCVGDATAVYGNHNDLKILHDLAISNPSIMMPIMPSCFYHPGNANGSYTAIDIITTATIQLPHLLRNNAPIVASAVAVAATTATTKSGTTATITAARSRWQPPATLPQKLSDANQVYTLVLTNPFSGNVRDGLPTCFLP